jgi:hypothetical protein
VAIGYSIAAVVKDFRFNVHLAERVGDRFDEFVSIHCSRLAFKAEIV